MTIQSGDKVAARRKPGLSLLQAATALWVAVLGGFFWAYAVTVSPGMRLAGPEAALPTMQAINIVVRNALFGIGFFGAALLCLAILLLALHRATRARWPTLVGAALGLAGGLGITVLGNVPLNQALAIQAPDAAASLAGFLPWLEDWSMLNAWRTLACLVAAALMLFDLARAAR